MNPSAKVALFMFGYTCSSLMYSLLAYNDALATFLFAIAALIFYSLYNRHSKQ